MTRRLRCIVGTGARGGSLQPAIWLSDSAGLQPVDRECAYICGPDGSTVAVFRGFLGRDGDSHESEDAECVLSRGAALCVGACDAIEVRWLGRPVDAKQVTLEVDTLTFPWGTSHALDRYLGVAATGSFAADGSRVPLRGLTSDAVAVVGGTVPEGPVKVVSSTSVVVRRGRSARAGITDPSSEEWHLRELVQRFHRQLGPERGVLVVGAPGSGKTYTCQRVLESLPGAVVPLRVLSLLRPEPGHGGRYLRAGFTQAVASAPSTVVIEDLDVLSGDSPVVEELAAAMERLVQWTGGGVAVVATTSSLSRIPHRLLGRMRFYHRVDITPKPTAERAKILQRLLGDHIQASAVERLAWDAAVQTPGFSPGDLRRVVSVAELTRSDPAETKEPELETWGRKLSQAATTVHPAVLSTCPWWRPFSNRSASPLFGLDDQTELLSAAIKEYLLAPRDGVGAARGALIHGAPGSGKTALVSKVTADSAAFGNIVAVSSADVVSSSPGETERNVRELFQFARASQPSVVVLENLEVLAPARRSTDSSDSARRLLTTILMELDGFLTEALEDRVFVVSTSRNREAIDPAMLRPGRIEMAVCMELSGIPPRLQILEDELGCQLDTTSLASELATMTGSQLRGIAREAKLRAYRSGRRAVAVEDLRRCICNN